ncbi:MAG: hypothetical protein JJE52_04650 [Acidimicrobiia bacterium]|nr:hypothetical protein [Acidimicrobiia bacterium]
MLRVFGFDTIGVVIGDLYFVDPRPTRGQEGPEQGVRIELRHLVRDEPRGSIYAAVPIAVDEPIWRVDLLESVDNGGSLDRAHHHPRFRGWNPGPRQFEPDLTADPVDWLGRQLTDLDTILARAEVDPASVGPGDADAMRSAVPEILGVVRETLSQVVAGTLGHPTEATPELGARAGWL